MTPAPVAAAVRRRSSVMASGRLAGAVLEGRHARLAGAMRAAVEAAGRLDAVPDDLAAAVLAHRRQPVDRALEGVEGVRGAADANLERLVVIVTTDVASSHGGSSLFAPRWPRG